MAITVPYPDFTAGSTIVSAQVDANFAELAAKALDKTGDTITGNISVSAGVTIDGVDISAAFNPAATTKSANYTATTADYFIACSGTFTLTLYAAAGNSGKTLQIKNVSTGVITVDGNASETIDGALTLTIEGQYTSYTLFCDGSNWHII